MDIRPEPDTTHCLPLDFEEYSAGEEGHAGAAVSAGGEETEPGLELGLDKT